MPLTDYPGSFKKMSEAISALGPTSTSLIKEESLRKWGALIEITGMPDIRDLQTKLETMRDTSNVLISLTPAGEDYVINESKQFEYFVSRILCNGKPRYQPLFSYLDINSVQEAITVINNVFEQVCNAVMSLGCNEMCQNDCHFRSCPYVFSDNPRVCTMMVRAYEMFSVIKMYMDYIDRYRVVLITKLSCDLLCDDLSDSDFSRKVIIDINKSLLYLLEKYNGAYDTAEEILSRIKFKDAPRNGCCFNLYDYILQITQRVINRTGYRLIYPQYYWRNFDNSNKNGKYPYKTKGNGFKRIIKLAEIDDINNNTVVLPLAEIMRQDTESKT